MSAHPRVINAFDRIRARRVADLVAAISGWPVEELLGRRRHAGLVLARHAAWRAARRAYGWSWPRLGAAFGVDHTSALHGANKAARCALAAEIVPLVVEAVHDGELAVVDEMIERLVAHRERVARRSAAEPPPRPATPARPTSTERDAALVRSMRRARRLTEAGKF